MATKIDLPDRYTVISELGSGAMGTVYKVQDANLDKILAIKVLNQDSVDQNPRLVPRFQVEATAAGKLKHENLVGVLDFGVNADGLPYLVMEFIEGISLKGLLKKKKKLPVSRAIDLFLQIASAMDHAHNNGVIHRDLKPANVVITKSEENIETVKVVDFGIAKILDENSDLTRTNAIMGSPLYMSPEQVRGEAADNRSDIYALGCMLFESLTGSPPIKGATALETMKLHVLQTAPGLNENAGEDFFPESLENLVATCLNKNADERRQSMNAVVDALENIKEELDLEEIEAAKETISIKAYIPDMRFLRRTAIGAVMFIMLFLSAAYFYSWNQTIFTQRLDESNSSRDLVESVDKDAANSAATVALMNESDRILLEQIDSNPTSVNLIVGYGVSNNGLLALKKAPHINNLVLKNCLNLNAESINEAIKDLPLVNLDLRTTAADDSTLKTIASKRNLELLDLTETFITSAGLVYLSDLKKLKYLKLRRTQLDDKNMEYIGKLKSLNELILHTTEVTDAGVESFVNLQDLLIINLEHTKVTGRSIKTLSRLSKLVDIYLAENNLAGVSLEPLTHLKYLHKLDVSGCNLSKTTIADFKRKRPEVELITGDS